MLSTACWLGALGAVACAPGRPADVVVYASGTDLESGNPLVTIHPLSRQLQRYALFVTLARYDSALAPVPYAARSWSWSADRRTLTMHMVNGLVWQDGVQTTANDAAFTVETARDPATGYPRASDLANVDTAIVSDDSTLVLRFHALVPSFPTVLCELPLVPAHRLAGVPRGDLRRAAFNLDPIGNGPFFFVSRTAGQRWVFRRNDRFPAALGGPPVLSGIVVVVVDEPTTKFAGLASGDLDVAGIAPGMAPLVRRDPTLRVEEYPVLFTTGVFLNTHRRPFDDVRVRRALDLSIDRQRIVSAALEGYGVPASGPIAPESPVARRAAPSLDPRRADSLLDAAGWRRGADGIRAHGGRALTFDLLTVGSGDNALEQLMQSDLAARGIRMEIRQVELGTLLSAARAPEKTYDALVTGIPGDLSSSQVAAMFDSRQRGGALDYAGFHNATLDASFASVRAAATPDAERTAWMAVQTELARDVPVVWIYHSRGLQGVSRRLRGVRMDLRGELVTVARWALSP